MAQLTGPVDQFQQDPSARNFELARLLNGPWNRRNIRSIERQPAPTEPPDPVGPRDGQWVAELA